MDSNYILKLIIQAQDEFSAELKNVSNQLENVQKSAKSMGTQANSVLSSIKKGIVSLGLGAAVVKASKSVVQLADNLEKSQIAFTTMLGSGEKAQQMLNDLSEFARRTPFELTGVRSTAQQLIAMGVNAEEIIPTLKSLGDVSAGLSVPLERLALNYGQVIAQGKLTGRELRDFTMAGVPLLDELSQMLGTTTTQIQDMISKGQITSNDVVQAFKNMSSEGGKFANLMSQQATTLSGLRSNFQDSLNSLGEEIGMQLLPSLKSYVQAMGKWLDDNIDNIKKVAQEVIDTAKVIADNVIGLVGDIGNALTTFAGFVNDISQGIADSTANSMTESSSATAQGLTGMAGNRHDFFYFVQQGITGIVGAIKTALNVADSLAKTVGKKSFWTGLYDSGTVKEYSEIKVYKRDENGILNYDHSERRKKGLLEQFQEGMKQTKDYIKNETKDIKDTRKESTDELYKDLEDNYAKQVEKLTGSIYTANQNVGVAVQSLNLTGAGGTDSLGSGGGSGKSKVEEMTQEMKDLIKEMQEYAKESEQMRKATYEGIVDGMEEAVKSAEKLSQEIVDLQKQINDLNDSENVDIASAYIKAEQTLKDYKKEYEDIVELSKEYTKAELENQNKDRTVYGFTAKDLLEVKNAYESMQSAFAGLTDEQKQALNDQIESQKAYNDLNSVEKIKADYEAKRKVLQDELNDKITAFETEMNKYEQLTTQKENYEKKWLDYMTYSYKEQQTMANRLIDLYRRLAEAKAEAGVGGSIAGTRAGGGTVYSGNSYLVGEHGPELFVPSQRGEIIPTNQITNNNGIEINMSGITVRSEADIQAIAEEITRKIKLEKNFGII